MHHIYSLIALDIATDRVRESQEARRFVASTMAPPTISVALWRPASNLGMGDHANPSRPPVSRGNRSHRSLHRG